MEASLRGIEKIAEAKALDVISLGTDQEAQEHFFHPELQDKRRMGAGGVPVRSAGDLPGPVCGQPEGQLSTATHLLGHG